MNQAVATIVALTLAGLCATPATAQSQIDHYDPHGLLVHWNKAGDLEGINRRDCNIRNRRAVCPWANTGTVNIKNLDDGITESGPIYAKYVFQIRGRRLIVKTLDPWDGTPWGRDSYPWPY